MKLSWVISILSVLIFFGCSSDLENGPKEKTFFNLSGVYRSTLESGQIKSVTSLEIETGASEDEGRAQVLRNGLSYEETIYFDSYGLLQWADSRFGRELALTKKREDLEAKNFINENEEGQIVVCNDKVSYSDLSLDFMYCLSLQREQEDAETAFIELTLYTYEFGEPINQIRLDQSVFIKDRLSVDYFGNWSGEITKEGGFYYDLELATGSDLFVTFQPISETEYIVRPQDVNQTIKLHNETFVLSPVNRPLSELEGNANPYINFIYVSEQNGNKIITYNSSVIREGRIEGNVTLTTAYGDVEVLATYWLEKD